MNKKSEKVIVVRVPEKLVNQFKQVCNDDFKTMSEAIRDLIKEYIKRGNDTNKNIQ